MLPSEALHCLLFIIYHYPCSPFSYFVCFFLGTITADFVLSPHGAEPAPLHVSLTNQPVLSVATVPTSTLHQVEVLLPTSRFIGFILYFIWHLSIRWALWLWDSYCSKDRSIQGKCDPPWVPHSEAQCPGEIPKYSSQGMNPSLLKFCLRFCQRFLFHFFMKY